MTDTATVRKLLSNRYEMSCFIYSLACLGICNCSGSAYNCNPYCYFERGILFVRLSDWVKIYACTEPDCRMIRGCQDPRAYDDPFPRPDRGELVKVWENGKWLARGPWEDLVSEILLGLLEKKRRVIEKRKEEARLEKERNRARESARIEKLRQAYAKAGPAR